MDNDSEHLNLLAVFHYVVGGLALLFSMFPTLHLVLGIAMLSGRLETDRPRLEMTLFGGFFVAMALIVISIGITYSICTIIAGRFLWRRERYLFCLVMAAISCVFFPFGTVLGVFTIIVLQRPSVKQAFQRR